MKKLILKSFLFLFLLGGIGLADNPEWDDKRWEYPFYANQVVFQAELHDLVMVPYFDDGGKAVRPDYHLIKYSGAGASLSLAVHHHREVDQSTLQQVMQERMDWYNDSPAASTKWEGQMVVLDGRDWYRMEGLSELAGHTSKRVQMGTTFHGKLLVVNAEADGWLADEIDEYLGLDAISVSEHTYE